MKGKFGLVLEIRSSDHAYLTSDTKPIYLYSDLKQVEHGLLPYELHAAAAQVYLHLIQMFTQGV